MPDTAWRGRPAWLFEDVMETAMLVRGLPGVSGVESRFGVGGPDNRPPIPRKLCTGGT